MSSGEPDDAKVSSPVRRGVCGKVPAKVTRHFPTLLYVVAKRATCMAFGTDTAGEGDFLGLLLSDGSHSPCPHGQKDEGCAARLRG